MKRKIIILLIVILVMQIAAIAIWNSAYSIAKSLGVGVQLIDCSALALGALTIVPSTMINELREGGRKDEQDNL